MSVILPKEHHEAWLSGKASKEILRTYPAELIRAWSISSRVNSPKNDDPSLIKEVLF
jgi:putative SOS response-associated peptidase YedK